MSLYYIQLTIISAKNLPSTKRISHSTDAYIEIQLITLANPFQLHPPYPVRIDIARLQDNYMYSRQELLQVVYGNRSNLHTPGSVYGNRSDLHTPGSVGGGWERAIDNVEQGVVVHSYGRTSVQVRVYVYSVCI